MTIDSTPPEPSSDREHAALDERINEIYGELRRAAERYLRGERPNHTLAPTDLVGEAYLRLAGSEGLVVNDRLHFFRLAAQAMRRVLIDHARARNAAKRGPDRQRITLTGLPQDEGCSVIDLLSLDEALRRLEAVDERQARIVEMHYFAGLNIEEIAQILDVSVATVRGEWRHAKAWLKRELREHDSEEAS